MLVPLFASLLVAQAAGAYVADGVQNYLMRFGYLPQSDMETGNLRSEDQLRDAIRRLQKFAHVPVTGEVDATTLALLRRPRCALPDVEDNYRRRKRFALHGRKWDYTNITWSLRTQNPFGLDPGQVRRELHRALDVWAQHSRLSFKEVNGDHADILVYFHKGYHGDGYPFDGRGQILAHAFFPGEGRGGDAHFDEEEIWVLDQYDDTEKGTSLFAVAAHEFGHSLGLSHSSVEGALMYPWYQGLKENFELPDDDRNGIQQLYGAKEERLWGKNPPYKPPQPPSPPQPEVPSKPDYPRNRPRKPDHPRPNYPERRPNYPESTPNYPERNHPDRKPDYPERRPEYPERRPEYPERRPEYPERRPEYPERRPNYPERRPEYPERRPEYPERRPEYPERRPEYPERRPDYPERRPDHPERRPDYPDRRPDQPERRPEHPERRPEHPERRPEHPERRPEHPERKPEHPERKPEYPEKKPAVESPPKSDNPKKKPGYPNTPNNPSKPEERPKQDPYIPTQRPHHRPKPTYIPPVERRTPPPTAKPQDEKPDTCDTDYDAISVIRREVFIFKGKYVWRIGDKGLYAGYPAPITLMWFGLPRNFTHVDAVYERNDTKIVFFIGKQYFVYDANRLLSGYPKPLTSLGLPDSLEKIDGAMIWGHNKKTYFYSGTMYWRFDEEVGKVELDYPRDMSMWKGVGYNIDCVFQWKDGKTYFFKGKGFWAFNDQHMRVEHERQMLSAPFWMGCPRQLESPFIDDEDLVKFDEEEFQPNTSTASSFLVHFPLLTTLCICRLFLYVLSRKHC